MNHRTLLEIVRNMYLAVYLPYFWRYCSPKTLECRAGGIRTGWMQRRNGCRKRRMHERRDAERRESRLLGYRKGGFWTGEIQNGRDAGQEG